MLLYDGNIIRNCYILWIILLVSAIGYVIIGIGIMKVQVLVFWRKVRGDRELSME